MEPDVAAFYLGTHESQTGRPSGRSNVKCSAFARDAVGRDRSEPDIVAPTQRRDDPKPGTVQAGDVRRGQAQRSAGGRQTSNSIQGIRGVPRDGWGAGRRAVAPLYQTMGAF